MKRRLTLVLCVLVWSCAAKVHAPANECSDPLGLYTNMAYQPCCHAHDVAYRVGGKEIDRLTADKALYSCIRDLGYASDAESMFVAVRVWGASRFRWR